MSDSKPVWTLWATHADGLSRLVLQTADIMRARTEAIRCITSLGCSETILEEFISGCIIERLVNCGDRAYSIHVRLVEERGETPMLV